LYGTPLSPMDGGGSDREVRAKYGLQVAGYAGLFILSQALFLFPRGAISLRTSDAGRSMWRAAIGAGLAGMLLTAGLLATLLEFRDTWVRLTIVDTGGPTQGFWPIWVAMLLLWVLWAAAFHHLWRNLDHRTAVSRTTRALLAGTVLEVVVAGPVHAWVLRKDDECHCARGSYTGLVFGVTVLVWLFGPGVVLLAMRERRRLSPRGETK
jgi:hypothetical protein